MFKIKMRCYDCGNRFAYVDYGVQTYTTAENALKDLIKDIKEFEFLREFTEYIYNRKN